MCQGGRLLADFTAGGVEKPTVPYRVEPSMTMTADGTWVVWARKYARAADGGMYVPLTAGTPYPADAVASCRAGHDHESPQPDCTCGFHAITEGRAPMQASPGRLLSLGLPALELDVVLSGRVLAFEWTATGVLFRAARQTVVRVRPPESRWPRPPELGGQLARLAWRDPQSSRPQRLHVPSPPTVPVDDDAGVCATAVRTAAVSQSS